MAKLLSINPANKKKIGEVEVSSENEVRKKVDKSRKGFEKWAVLSLEERVRHLRKVVKEFKRRKEELATLATREMGMPITDSRYDVDDSISYFNWYLENAEKYLSPEITFEDEKTRHAVYHEPVGVVAAITPWNYPTSNTVWAAGQGLVSGNTVVYKTSEECPLFGKLIEKIMNKHLPPGVFEEVYGDGEVGKRLAHSDIDFINFTGSTRVGKYLYKVASEKFIKIVLELGGSAPGIIFADGDLEKAVENVFFNRFGNCGQICDGLKRLIVHEKVASKVIRLLQERIKITKMGDPMKKDTELGPLVSAEQLKVLIEQVQDAKKKGAKVVIGGKEVKEMGGYFYAPTLLTNVRRGMRVWKEEVFGPVLPIVSFKTEEEAIRLANDTKYGLGSYVYSKNISKAKRVSSKIKSGMVSINGVSYVEPFNPFGGCKLSGLGREHGKYGFRELTQIKVVSSEK